MNELPRLLAIMGSGETSPTMSKVHRDLFGRLGAPPVPAVLLDTPFGFQENADIISARAVEYFRVSVNRDVAVASFRKAGGNKLESETSLARLRQARWVFSGPGSPSYALKQWKQSPVPAAIADKLRTGGCITFASAAAATLGRLTVPVYEIYKVGQEPHWVEGLDLLAQLGIPAIVIPHFNNAEGGNHDTRFCYLGERRLATMERDLRDDEIILGLDEHTGAVFDLDASTVSVVGLGHLTLRGEGSQHQIKSGQTVAIDDLRADPASPRPTAPNAGSPAHLDAEAATPASDPLGDGIIRLEREFDEALSGRDGTQAVSAALELDQLLVDWSRDTLQSDLINRGRAAMRAMIVRLGEAAIAGLRDPAEAIGPFVEAVLQARSSARADGRYAEADELRDRLVGAGVEIKDGRGATEWQLR